MQAAVSAAAVAVEGAATAVKLVMQDDDALMMSAAALTMPTVPRPLPKMGRIASAFDTYTDADFMSHVRLRRATFDWVLHRIRDHPVFVQSEGRPQLPIEHQLFAALWHLAAGSSFRQDSQTTGLAVTSVWEATVRVITALIDTCYSGAVTWYATSEEKRSMARRFEEKVEIPGVIASVDGTLIPVKNLPHAGPVAYRDRSGEYSVVLHAAVDVDCRFRHVLPGCPGSFGDSRTYQMTRLYALRSEMVGYLFTLVGDSAYGLDRYLLTRFRAPDGKTEADLPEYMQVFNKCLSRVRVYVEKAFGILKGRWHILAARAQFESVETVVNVINACVTLHNICIDAGDVYPVPEVSDPLLADELDPCVGDMIAARDRLARMLAELYTLGPAINADGSEKGGTRLVRRLGVDVHSVIAQINAAGRAGGGAAAASSAMDLDS